MRELKRAEVCVHVCMRSFPSGAVSYLPPLTMIHSARSGRSCCSDIQSFRPTSTDFDFISNDMSWRSVRCLQ